MALEYSPEQLRLFEAGSGGYIVVANAGTGKTTSSAELIVRRYLAEEERLFPSAEGHVSDADQRRILRQFLCVTFTVKAAAELDSKIKHLFAERGIPLPRTTRGDEYRIAKTLDAYLRQWLMEEHVFAAWMATDPDTSERARAVMGMMPSDVRSDLGCPGGGNKDLHSFSRRWPWLAGDDVATMLLDCILRHRHGASLEGCDIRAWAGKFDETFRTAIVSDGEIDLQFWEGPLKAWKAHQERLSAIEHGLKQGKPLPEADQSRALGEVRSQERLVAMREEFLSVQELARARGYHPAYAPEKLAGPLVENQLAASEFINSYAEFSAIALSWHRIKTHFLLREFGDQITAFVRACEAHPQLLEWGVEYPRMVRRKYVFWDEVQDNSDFQHRILNLFHSNTGAFLSVAVGDPKQQIYSWRGASPRGFLKMIERKRRKEPGKLLGLTCSFRSTKKIVALGNEIIQTLPSYRDSVQPSTTVYQDEGIIEVTKPFCSVDEEAEWVFARVEQIISKTKDSIMIVSRTDIRDHPLYFRHLKGHPESGKRVSCLTVHKAKGLEADVVFVLGLVAGHMPDVRSNADEEVNLFYVACTRARHTLILCGLVASREIDERGHVTDLQVGPSPYFSKVPSLKALCLTGGWPQILLSDGVAAHNQALAMHLSRIDKRRGFLIAERHAMFPEVMLGDGSAEGLTDYGVTEASSDLALMAKRNLQTPDQKKAGQMRVSLKAQDRVKTKLVAGLKIKGRVPFLGNEEFTIAVRSGWIAKQAGEKCWQFTDALRMHAQMPSPSAPGLSSHPTTTPDAKSAA